MRSPQSLISAFAIAGSVWAGDARPDDATRMAIPDQMQAELSACVAFYTIDRGCGANREAQSRLSLTSKRADALAEVMAMAPADAALRLELNLTALRSLIGNSCKDLAVLESRYQVECESGSAGPR